jgi:hypothetical protein
MTLDTYTNQMKTDDMITIVELLASGVTRVLNGQAGMTFVVDRFTKSADGGYCAHVIDLRYNEQIWTLSPDQYRVIHSLGI